MSLKGSISPLHLHVPMFSLEHFYDQLEWSTASHNISSWLAPALAKIIREERWQYLATLTIQID